MAGLEDRESLLTHLRTKRDDRREVFGAPFLSIQQNLEDSEQDNAYWARGAENPTDGMILLRLLQWQVIWRLFFDFWNLATLIEGRCDHCKERTGRKERAVANLGIIFACAQIGLEGWLETRS